MMINDNGNLAQTYADLFNCQIGYFPIKYLDVPVSPNSLHIIDWVPFLRKLLEDIMRGRVVQ